MSTALRRKVDQQLVLCHHLVQMAGPPEQRSAMGNALAWQLEHTVCFYLQEVARTAGHKRWSHTWTLDLGLLQTAHQTVHSADFQELVDLAQQPGTWLAVLLNTLQCLRRVDESPVLKGAVFQSDLVQPDPEFPDQNGSAIEHSQGNPTLIASSLSASAQLPGFDELIRTVGELQSFIQRQRLGHEEY